MARGRPARFLAAFLFPAGLLLLLGASCGGDEEVAAPSGTAAGSPTQAAPSPTTTLAPSPVTSPSPVPSIPADWQTYTDPVAGFSVAYPPNLAISEKTAELREQKGDSVVRETVIAFGSADGVFAFYVAAAENEAGLSLEQWVKTYPGWPSEPARVTIGGQAALRFDRNALDEPDARAYVIFGGKVYIVAGNVFGSGEGGYGPRIQEADFETVLNSLRFAE